MATRATALGAAVAFALTGGCTGPHDTAGAAGDAGGMIVTVMCAPAGASEFSADCSLEREDNQLTIRHANGTFRRFVLDGENRISSADGADALHVAEEPDGFVELRIAGDRYRLDRAALKREQGSGNDADS